jgi:hypothetical protein
MQGGVLTPAPLAEARLGDGVCDLVHSPRPRQPDPLLEHGASLGTPAKRPADQGQALHPFAQSHRGVLGDHAADRVADQRRAPDLQAV